MNSKDIHTEHIERIRRNPKILRLDNIVISTGEAAMFVDGKLYHEADNLLFDPTTKVLYNVEYKCSNHHKDRAMLQLMEEEEVLHHVFPAYKIISLYAHEDYKVQKVRETI